MLRNNVRAFLDGYDCDILNEVLSLNAQEYVQLYIDSLVEDGPQ